MDLSFKDNELPKINKQFKCDQGAGSILQGSAPLMDTRGAMLMEDHTSAMIRRHPHRALSAYSSRQVGLLLVRQAAISNGLQAQHWLSRFRFDWFYQEIICRSDIRSI